MSGLPVIKNTTLGYNFIFVFSLKLLLKQSNHSHIVNIKRKSSLFLTIHSHVSHTARSFPISPRTLTFSCRKPASSRVSCNSCPAHEHSNKDNLECHRQHINTSSIRSPKQHMQESVSRANAVQWKYSRVNCYSFYIAFPDTVLVNSTYIWYILYVKCHNSLCSDVILFEKHL